MAKTKPATALAKKDDNGAIERAKKLAAMPVPEGWFDAVIFDVDPEYVAQSGLKMVVLKLRVTGSLRYGARTFQFFVGEELESTQRNDGGSTRADIIERFGIDPWKEPDAFLDLEVRTHIGTRILNEGEQYQKTVNRVVSIYPKLQRAKENNGTQTLENELPL